jgi:hypothetical protein
MTANTTTVKFTGICTHVTRPVSEISPVTYRVVLVHAEDGAYINGKKIPPHIPMLKLDPADIVSIEGYPYGLEPMLHAGVWRLCGVQLTLEGVTDHARQPDPAYNSEVPRLTKLTPDAPSLSEDVVSGGQAACYFDIGYGRLSAETIEQGAIAAVLKVDTTSEPALRVFCFWNRESSLIRLRPGATIHIEHTGGQIGDSDYDFLLHYRVLKSVPGDAKVPAGKEKPRGSHPSDIGGGCSNSAYP